MPTSAEGSEAQARHVARRLADVPGVVGVMLGGSHARGNADEASDIDLGIFYRASDRPSLVDLRSAAAALGADGIDSLTGYGEWGPWIEGGAWLTVAGGRVDWLYRDIDRISRVVDDCRYGRLESAHQPGHPHGFHSHIHFGEVALGRILEDRAGELAALKGRTTPYPDALREAIVRVFAWQARFALQIAHKPAARGDVAYLSGCLFTAAGCLVQVLFALNDRPFVSEKGALAEAAGLPVAPPELRARIEAALSLDSSRRPLGESLQQLERLTSEVEALAKRSGGRA